MTEPERKIIYQHLNKLLARREHSVQELQQKMLAKGLSAELTEQMIATFQQQGWQSDQRFAQMQARSQYNKGYGPERIRASLRQHQLSDEYIEQAIDSLEADWYQLAIQVYQKKYTCAPQSWQDKQKRMAFLQYRGFSHAHIQAAIEE